jgi:hypothetical protein
MATRVVFQPPERLTHSSKSGFIEGGGEAWASSLPAGSVRILDD